MCERLKKSMPFPSKTTFPSALGAKDLEDKGTLQALACPLPLNGFGIHPFCPAAMGYSLQSQASRDSKPFKPPRAPEGTEALRQRGGGSGTTLSGSMAEIRGRKTLKGWGTEFL